MPARTHGLTETKLYAVWIAMKQRCEHPNNKSFSNYGGRGISVCAEWHDFAVFAAWAAEEGYAEGLAIDRIDNDGPYAPENCHWVTQAANNWNRRDTIRHTYWGEELPLHVAARRFGVDPDTIKRRIAKGMAPEQAVAQGRRIRAPLPSCKRGHAFSDANTVIVQGKRQCRACNLLRQRARDAGLSVSEYVAT